MTFGEKLQRLRARAGLSQDALAELLDVSRQAVSKWERDEAMPEAEKLVRISRQFGVSSDCLLLEEAEMPEPQAPGGSLWTGIRRWYRNKGWLLCWAVAAWGGVRLLRGTLAAADLCRSAGVTDPLARERLLWGQSLPEIILAALLAAAGVALALRGRRMAGRIRWYHLGWLPVLAGLLGTGDLPSGPLRFLTNGAAQTVFRALLSYLPQQGPDRVGEFLRTGLSQDAGCLLAAGLGLAVLLLGRHLERAPRRKA